MTSSVKRTIAMVFIATFFASTAYAQDLRVFESEAVLDAEIEKYMSEGAFSALVEAVAPPSRNSGGRIRILEQTLEGEPPSFTQNAPIFQSQVGDAVKREVVAWWDGDTYIYMGMLTHAREDDVVVLDFIVTGDIRNASRWFLTGNT